MKPPLVAQKLLRSVLRDELMEDVLGDLEEKFYKTASRHSAFRAKVNYWFQTINYIRPFALRRRRSNIKTNGMLNNNLKIGWRHMQRQKMYSAIKIGGFALGIAASLLITLYIKDELSFDTQPQAAHRIYRIYETYTEGDKIYKWVWFQAPFAKVVKQQCPEVELVGRYNSSELFGVGSAQIRRDDQPDNSYEEGITYFDQELLELLEIPLIYGDIKTCLDERNEVVITRKKADKYWPGENPVGKLVIYNNETETPIKIGGVIEDFPANSSLQFDWLVSMANREMWKGEQDAWYATNYPTYVRLREGANPNDMIPKLMKIAETYMAADRPKDFMEHNGFGLQPLKEIHLKSTTDEIQSPVTNTGDMRFAWLFGAVAVFIMLIACINFINLSTAKSASRAKEVGLRKTVGSYRSYLIGQFLIESLIYSVLSFVIGVVLAWVILPNFNELAGKSIVFPWTQVWFIPGIIGAAVVVGLLAGIYPSFYLSSFKPAEVLKGSFARSGKNAVTRSALVVFQFTTSVILIIATVVIYRQMNHILNTKLGYEKDQVLILKGTNILGKQTDAFRDELLGMSTVKAVTISDYLPVRGTKRNGNGFRIEGEEKGKDFKGASGQFWRVDEGYAATLGLKIVDGRFFEKKMASDSDAIVINQRMVKELGLTNPIGARIVNYRAWNVIGVVEDFYYENLRGKIEPLAMVLNGSTNTISVKLSTNDMGLTISNIDDMWRRFSPHQPIRTAFLDDSFARMYDDVRRMGQIFTSFAVFAIVVACLGLFALSAFMVEQRGKEISIRLVLGASVRSIFQLLTVNFVRLVLISIVIAAPIAYYMMNEWLSGFDAKTTIGWDVYVVAGFIALIIAVGTISYQSIRAGLVKPVGNLRSE
ncbi:MAG TPA: FtsX-like permease family protein [Cyclobacteriaceae bacterium]